MFENILFISTVDIVLFSLIAGILLLVVSTIFAIIDKNRANHEHRRVDPLYYTMVIVSVIMFASSVIGICYVIVFGL